MSPSPSNALPAADDTLWHRVELLLDTVEQMAAQTASPGEFYKRLIEQTATVLAARGGAVWLRTDNGNFEPLAITHGANDAAGQNEHLNWATSRHGAWIASLAERQAGPGVLSSTDQPADVADGLDGIDLLVAPLAVDGRVVGMVEFLFGPDAPDAVRRHGESVLGAVANAASGFQQRHEVGELRRRLEESQSAIAYVRAVHRSIKRMDVCRAIATEGRRLLGGDRLSVVVQRGSRQRVQAVSGVDDVDRRSDEVRAIERLAEAVARTGEPIWSDDSTEPPPQIESRWSTYFDVAATRSVGLVPLSGNDQDGRPPGWLVVEQYHREDFDAAARRLTQFAAEHGGTALANAVEVDSLPLVGLSRGLRTISRWLAPPQLPKTALSASGLVVVVAALYLIPAEFKITARGELQPAVQCDVFATIDGQITATYVEHGDRVEPEALLIELRNAELDYESARLQGEIDTTRTRWQALEPRLNQRATTADEVARLDADVAEVERLKTQLAGLQRQQVILDERRAELQIRAPIGGEVLSWNVTETLASRPIRRGQKLLTLGDPTRHWTLEMNIADSDIGHVLAARDASAEPLPIQFILVTDPSTVHAGHLRRIALATDATLADGPAVAVTADIAADKLDSPRPGAGVIARIDCGQRSIGYVWLRRLIETARKQLFF